MRHTELNSVWMTVEEIQKHYGETEPMKEATVLKEKSYSDKAKDILNSLRKGEYLSGDYILGTDWGDKIEVKRNPMKASYRIASEPGVSLSSDLIDEIALLKKLIDADQDKRSGDIKIKLAVHGLTKKDDEEEEDLYVI